MLIAKREWVSEWVSEITGCRACFAAKKCGSGRNKHEYRAGVAELNVYFEDTQNHKNNFTHSNVMVFMHCQIWCLNLQMIL